jgi:copper chaperone CopZ
MKIYMMIFLCLISTWSFAQFRTDTILVKGNCEHCKERIETAVKINGVAKADWNIETNKLIITYNPSVITSDKIQQQIAGWGHDTEKYPADNKSYKNLPECCKYSREKIKPGMSEFKFRILDTDCREECLKKIGDLLYMQKGVKLSDVNTETGIGTVLFDATKISREKILEILSTYSNERNKAEKLKFIEIR